DGLTVHGVAAEQLVGTFSGQDYLHISGGVLGQEVERHFAGVGHGLIQIPLNGFIGLKKLVGAYLVYNAGNPDFLAECLSIGKLAVLALLISHTEGFYMA